MYYGSPIVDLIHFFSISVSVGVLRDYKDELIYSYHKKLQDTLKTVKYEGYVPTLTELHTELLKRGILGK